MLFQIHICCEHVDKIRSGVSQKQKECTTVEELLLSVSNSLYGQGLLATAPGNCSILWKALDSFLISAR